MNLTATWTDMLRDGLARLRRGWIWVIGEYLGLSMLIALGLLWTRIPEKNGGQVTLTLALPVLIAAGFLWLQAGFVRGFLQPATDAAEATEHVGDQQQVWVPFAWGAATLLVWIVIGWVLWVLLDRFDDRIWQWAAYLNSKFDLHARGRWASYAHLSRDLGWAEWVLRWVVVPGLLVPVAVCSAAWGILRLPWRRTAGLWVSWKWWPVVIAWALIGEAWPQTWFDSQRQGTVREQVWRVGLKLAAAYLLGVTAWVKVLGWGAMRVNPGQRARKDEPFLTLGLETQVRPAAEIRADKLSDGPAAGGGALGRPLPRGGENGSGQA